MFLTRQKPYDCLTDRGFFQFFSKSFWTKMSVAIPRSVRPEFFFKDISDWDVNDHTRYQRRVRGMVTDVLGQKRDKIKKKTGLWDRSMAIDVSIKNDLEKKTEKTLIRKTAVWSLPDRVKNLNATLRRP